jgi:hypothetical protein
MPDQTDNSGRFPPGKTGNPGGRPKGLAKLVRETIGEGAAKALIQAFYDLAMDEDQDGRVRVAAGKEVLDRGWGKAQQSVDVTSGGVPVGSVGVVPVNLGGLTDAQLAALRQQLQEAEPPPDDGAGDAG